MPTYVGTQNGYQIYQDAAGCFFYDPVDGSPIATACPFATGSPVPPLPVNTYPSGGGGGLIQPGGSWLNDTLNTILGLAAIENHQSVGAQGVNNNTNRYPSYGVGGYPSGVAPVTGGIGTAAGATVGSFLQNNGFLLLIGVGVFLLYKSGRK